MDPTLARQLADAVLVLHVLVVVFVVGGLAAIVLGHRRGWHWAGGLPLRVAHAVAVAVVVAQAWLGVYCPLTLLEVWLRRQAGEGAYATSFVGHWLQRLLYVDAPPWVFVLVYTAFGGLVAWIWWRHPPRRRRPPAGDDGGSA